MMARYAVKAPALLGRWFNPSRGHKRYMIILSIANLKVRYLALTQGKVERYHRDVPVLG